MGSYRNDDEALIGLARQLTDAYGEARRREDQDYACESVAEFLSEFRDAAPSEALLAILDLPLTAETYPLVDEAQVALAARGPGVVELLLEAVLGDVYDPDGPAPERAAETLDLMDPGEASLGLCRGAVRPRRRPAQGRGRGRAGRARRPRRARPRGRARRPCGRGVGPGGARAAALRARASRSCSRTRRRSRRTKTRSRTTKPRSRPPGRGAGHRGRRIGPVRTARRRGRTADADDDGQPAGTGEAAEPAVPSGNAAAGPAGPRTAGPDQALVDDTYDDFLRRFEQESGGEPSSS